MNTAKKNKIYLDIQHAEEILAKPAAEDSENIQTRRKQYISEWMKQQSLGGRSLGQAQFSETKVIHE